jgi:hypothetical protein
MKPLEAARRRERKKSESVAVGRGSMGKKGKQTKTSS